MSIQVTKIRQQLIDEARTWLGTPFRHQGRLRSGVDCAGLLINIFMSVMDIDYDIKGYPVAPNKLYMLKQLKKICNRVPFGQEIPGDVVLLNQGAPTHLALLTDKGIIHGTREFKKVVEQRINKKIRSQIMGYWRLKVLDNG